MRQTRSFDIQCISRTKRISDFGTKPPKENALHNMHAESAVTANEWVGNEMGLTFA